MFIQSTVKNSLDNIFKTSEQNALGFFKAIYDRELIQIYKYH